MNRQKLVDAILALHEKSNQDFRADQLREALKYISDSSLVVLADEIGIDTDALFA